MRKIDLHEEARQLRGKSGLSVKEIAHMLNVAPSSVSVWVRDIELTYEQHNLLQQRKALKFQRARESAIKTNQAKYLNLRLAYQQEGRLQAQKRDPLHIAGCMLYWAEGKKQRNALSLVNSDPDMLRFYAKFLRESLQVTNAMMVVHINCYINNGLPLEAIEDYWLDTLDLLQTNLRKSIVNQQPSSSKQRGRKLIYGVCALSVYDTRIVQHVYGAIQESGLSHQN